MDSTVQYQLLAEISDQGVWVIDAQGNTTEVNASMAEMLGYTVTEMVGRSVFTFMDPEWRGVAATMLEGGRNGIRKRVEFKLRRKEGSDIWTLISMVPFSGQDGGFAGAFGTVVDITERKRAEEALREAKERAELMQRVVPSPIFTVDPDRVITSWNLRAAEVTGYSEDEVVGKPCTIFAQSPCKERCEVFSKAGPAPIVGAECAIKRKDGQERLIHKNAEILTDSEGNVVGAIESFEDVTQLRASTQQLVQWVGDLQAVHETALSLNAMRNLEGVLRQTLRGLQRVTAASRSRVLLLERDGSAFALRAELVETGGLEVVPDFHRPGPLSSAILDEKQARFVNDVNMEGADRSSSMAPSVQAYAAVPLLTPDRLIGLLYLTYDRTCEFPANLRKIIQIIASHSAVAVANIQMFEDANRAAMTDALTKLPNHRHLMGRLDHEMTRATRSGHPMSLMMIDIDDFKLVNDAHGHTVGDWLLQQVAKVLRDSLRTTDIVGRYGGDEFLAILPETDQSEAVLAAERLLTDVRGIKLSIPYEDATAHANRDSIPVRLSVGISTYPFDSSARLELISLADTAMYSSKQAGGNMATLAQTTDSRFLADQSSAFSVLEGLVNAVDAKDHYTKAHSEQVAHHALRLAEVLGLTTEQKRMLRVASLLHDVGKIGIPDRILRKPGPLNQEERDVISQHPLLGEMIIREIPHLSEMIEAVRHHHERFDGKGYPRGLQGTGIPFLSRLIAVADAYSAMTLDRPYRNALSEGEAISELRRCAGTQLDPSLVTAFIGSLDGDQPPDDIRANVGASDL